MKYTKKPVWGSIDTPSFDYVIPKWEIIEAELKKHNIDPSKASDLYDDILDTVGREVKGGTKFTVEKDKIKTLRGLALQLEQEIKPCGLEINCSGGTGNNKLACTKAILGNKIEAKLFGAVGNDARGQFLSSKAEKAGLELIDIGESLNYTREILLITPKGEDDRIGAKFPYKEPSAFRDVNKLIDFAKNCDYFYLESSLIKFLGAKDFTKFVDETSASGTKIVFAAPTDKVFFLDSTGKPIRENIEALHQAGRKAYIVTMNEIEAIHYTGRPKFNNDIDSKTDKNFVDALNKIERNLKDIGENKYALVTAGKHGMVAISKNYRIDTDSVPPKSIINTVGAGDSAAATFAALLSQEKVINAGSLTNATNKASCVASEVISQNPAQVTKEIIKHCLGNSISY